LKEYGLDGYRGKYFWVRCRGEVGYLDKVGNPVICKHYCKGSVRCTFSIASEWLCGL